jgi:hypothetical protein
MRSDEATGRLTVKLRGRPEAPNQATRAHNLFRARGADTQVVHGPLQRLLEAGSVTVLNRYRNVSKPGKGGDEVPAEANVPVPPKFAMWGDAVEEKPQLARSSQGDARQLREVLTKPVRLAKEGPLLMRLNPLPNPLLNRDGIRVWCGAKSDAHPKRTVIACFGKALIHPASNGEAERRAVFCAPNEGTLSSTSTYQ